MFSTVCKFNGTQRNVTTLCEVSNMNPLGVVIVCIISGVALILACIALFTLHKKTERKPADLLLLHLLVARALSNVWGLSAILLSFFTNQIYYVFYNTGLMMMGIALYQSNIWVTIDRVLSVFLALKYRAIVTKTTILQIFVSIWLIDGVHVALVFLNVPKKYLQTIWLTWDSLTICIILLGYLYIITSVHQQRNKLRQMNSNLGNTGINYKVPITVACSFLFLVVLPDLLTITGTTDPYNVWMWIPYAFDGVVDPLVYVLYSRYLKIRN